MSDICTVRKSTLDGIAEAIQSKTGESGRMLPSEMAGKIEDLPSQPAKGLVFSEYDADGYPHKAEFVGSWTEIPDFFLTNIIRSDALTKNIRVLSIPSTVATIGKYSFTGCYINDIVIPKSVHTIKNEAFQRVVFNTLSFEAGNTGVEVDSRAFSSISSLITLTIPSFMTIKSGATTIWGSCNNLTTVTFEGNPFNIGNSYFNNCTKVSLYDFSHATAIPSLYSVASLGHASGCVIRIPLALSDQTLGTGNGWESATNWSALTNVTWEAV